jgi:hypothetical protein
VLTSPEFVRSCAISSAIRSHRHEFKAIMTIIPTPCRWQLPLITVMAMATAADPVQVAVSAQPTVLMEGSAGAFTLARTGSTVWPLTVAVQVDGPAAVGGDLHPALPGTVVFPVGAARVTVDVNATADQVAESDESLTLAVRPGWQSALVANVPQSGLVALIPCDEGAGVVASDRSGQGHTAQLDGAVWVAGSPSPSLGLDGAQALSLIHI